MLPKKDSRLFGQFFSVEEKPFCVWMTEETNHSFLNGIDTDYFWYLAETHGKQLEGEHKLKSAISLKLAYYQGIETFFMLLFAAVFAPKGVPGWLLKCRTEQLREILQSVKEGKPPKFPYIELEGWSWKYLSELITNVLFENAENKDQLIGWFSEMWEKFANDFCQKHTIAEYNSIKHGFRVNASKGPTLKFSPPENTNDGRDSTVFNSEFGINFFSQKEIPSTSDTNLNHHFILTACHVNLNPRYLTEWIHMVSMSIKNVVAFLYFLNGYQHDNLQIMRPANEETFALLKPKTDDLTFIAFSPNLYTKDVIQITKEKILGELSKPILKINQTKRTGTQ